VLVVNRLTVLFVCLLFFSLFVVETTVGQPSVIDIIPGDPTQQSSVRFVASRFVNETVENVTLVVLECTNKSVSNETISVPMTKNAQDGYEATITLLRNDTTYIQYYVTCTVDGVVRQSPVLTLDILPIPPQDSTPGLVFVVIVCGVILIVALFIKIKR
jgi:hypothetical protein